MSTARHHSEWLSLIEVSGPFLTLSVLMQAFPQGLDAHDPELMRSLRGVYGEWQENLEGRKPDPAIHRAWIEFVLREMLGYPDEVLLGGQKIPETLRAHFPEHGELLRPDWVIVTPTGSTDEGKPRLLIQMVAADQSLDKPLAERRWKASPATRMMELLHTTNVRLGLLTNGHRWMLVNAPKGETTGFISWYTNLWFEDQITYRSFRSLLSVNRQFAVEDNQTLEALLKQSANDQEEVTTQLGYQVRKAVEVLVQKLDKLDKDRNRSLLKGVPESDLYKSALTVMMRLVFLFSAEEQGLLLLGDPIYDAHYAVSTLREQLREEADKYGEEVLERRSDAWSRLLATFRAVHSGVHHDLLLLPAYGGHLFDPDRFTFLEGREEGSEWQEVSARPLQVDNRTVLHLLEALQILQVKVPGGGSEPRKLSFRALDVEQIGHVYEGLLDHDAVRAKSPVLGFAGTKDKEPEVHLEELERVSEKGEEKLLEFLREETSRSLPALKNALAVEINPLDVQRFLVACDHDLALWQRVKPFAGIVRKDNLGYPVIFNTGGIYVTQSSERRSTGTHYTPRSLTEPIVQYTLEPLVYLGPAEGLPRAEWQLKPAGELLKLKVCDFAMGSGAFLVQACRYLAERLVDAWDNIERAHPGQMVVTPEGNFSAARPDEELISKEPTERVIVAKRIVADRCIYGVDKNLMAVEMAKLSLWLVTMQKNRPFTFLDHALRCGDSLLGVTDAKQIEYFHLQPEIKTQSDSLEMICKPIIEKAIAKRKELESFLGNDIQAIERKERLYLEAEEALDKVRFLGDLLIGEALKRMNKSNDMATDEWSVLTEEVTTALSNKTDPYQNLRVQSLRDKAKGLLGERRPFHWLLEFPEVFSRNGESGFDAIVGNPPFQGGQKITGTLGTDYRDFLVEQIADGKRGSADLCAYFFLRGEKLLATNGGFGLLATNTIAQGDTREVGLDRLVANGIVIPRAVPSRKWPGSANLEVAHIWLRKGEWKSEAVLDEKPVVRITSFLTIPGKATGMPFRLIANQSKSFQGSIVLGMGFIMSPEEAQRLIDKNPKNKEVLFPYLNGEDLNSQPDQSASRWVINFFDWPLNHKNTPERYSGPVAADYPDCLTIVSEKVKPERDVNSDKGARDYWWRFLRPRSELYSTIAGMERVLVTARVSAHHFFAFVTRQQVFSDRLVVITSKIFSDFVVLSSSLHDSWAHRPGSTTHETRSTYFPEEAFETFSFPHNMSELDLIGEKYHSYRKTIMQSRQEGLTKTYNRYHNPTETSSDIAKLRVLHINMDLAVATAYGWNDLDLEHGFHETKQGIRYTISEAARQEVLDRLLQLNHERYAEEVRQGLHDKGTAKRKTKSNKSSKKKEEIAEQPSLF